MRTVWMTCLVGLVVGWFSHDALGQFASVAASPDGGLVAAGGSGKFIWIWNRTNGTVMQRLTASGPVKGLFFVGDGSCLAAGEDEKGVELWRTAENGPWTKTQLIDARTLVYAMSASFDGKWFAAGGHSGWTSFYDSATGKPLGVLFERSNLTCGLACSPDGTFMATAGNSFSVWDIRTNSPLWQPRADRAVEELEITSKRALRWSHPVALEAGDAPYCDDIAISPDNRWVTGVNGVSRHDSGGQRLYLWEAQTGAQHWLSRAAGMTCVAFVGNGSRIVTGSDDGQIRIWETETGKLITAFHGHDKAVRNLARIPGGVVSAADDGKVILWDGQSGRRMQVLRAGK